MNQQATAERPAKKEPEGGRAPEPALDRAALADVIELALWTGQLLMENGAESQRVEETIRSLGTGLGCDWSDVLVSANAITITYVSGGEFRTRIRRVHKGGVNMTLVAGISHMTHRTEEGKYDRFKVRSELERISTTPRHYGLWLTVFAVGLACAAFSRLLGGDWPVFGVTLVSACGAMLVRQELAQREFNTLLVVVAAAFAAGLVVGITNVFRLSSRPELALAAAVLLLVPGVPFINAVEDLIKGHTVVGLARGMTATLIIFAIAIGLLLAMALTGISGL